MSDLTVLLRSRDSAERTVRQILQDQISREKLIANRDAELERVKKKHDPAIDELTGQIDLAFELLETWAEDNQQEFGDARSIAIAGCRVGWRTGQPTVKPKGKLTLKSIVSRLMATGGDLKARFIREKPELNKEAVLAIQRVAVGRDPEIAELPDAEREATQAAARHLLKDLGLCVVQTESFYLEPDREGQPEIRLVAEVKEAKAA